MAEGRRGGGLVCVKRWCLYPLAFGRYSILKVMLIFVTLVAKLRSNGENQHESAVGPGERSHLMHLNSGLKRRAATLVRENRLGTATPANGRSLVRLS